MPQEHLPEAGHVETDVLVVGGGPVGLSVAIGLRRHGIDCVLVERHPSTLDFPKGRRINTRTMEIFRQWGLEDEIAAAALPSGESLFAYRGETLLANDYAHLPLGGTDTPHSPMGDTICSQELLEPILLRRAEADGADVRYATRLTSFEPDTAGVTSVLTELETGERTTVRSRYLVAADGARGETRAHLGIGDGVRGVLGDRVSIHVEADLADHVTDRRSGLYLLGRPRPGTAFAAVDNKRQWLLMIPRDAESEPEELFTVDRCDELTREAIGDPGVAFRVRSRRFWTAIARVADGFSAGRVLLAGDAAHQTTPIGGLGMNCGVGDAHNLAWKLAGVVQGWADPALLDSYDTERRPVADLCAEASLGAATPPRSIDGLVLGAVYTSAAIIPDDTPEPVRSDPLSDYEPTARPGHRAPHSWIELNGRRHSTLDLWSERFTILVGPDCAAVTAAAAAASRTPVRTVVVGGSELSDPDGALAQGYGLTPDGALLVRPDGYVAWRTRRLVGEDLVSALKTAAGSPRLTPAASS